MLKLQTEVINEQTGRGCIAQSEPGSLAEIMTAVKRNAAKHMADGYQISVWRGMVTFFRYNGKAKDSISYSVVDEENGRLDIDWYPVMRYAYLHKPMTAKGGVA